MPIKGGIVSYDPHNYDDFYAEEYGGFGSGQGGGGGGSRGPGPARGPRGPPHGMQSPPGRGPPPRVPPMGRPPPGTLLSTRYLIVHGVYILPVKVL